MYNAILTTALTILVLPGCLMAPTALHPSQTEPELTLPVVRYIDTTGNASTIPTAGEIVVLEILSPSCQSCKKVSADLDRLARKERFKDVRFVGIVLESDQPAADALRKTHKISFHWVADPHGELAAPFSITGVPAVFVIDRSGRVAFQSTGGREEMQRLAAVLMGFV
ncbi:MAG: TlpA disulfide reductase family protein [Myxococcota bacterium]|nr:TlpA disulfide reductase family protein [Myxococcota bacterium]